MKKVFLAVVGLLLMASSAFVDDYVNGYTRSNGSYVEGHYRSSANSTRSDNYSTIGNVIPYTGKRGTKSAW